MDAPRAIVLVKLSAIGDVLHALWQTCERAGRTTDFVIAANSMVDAVERTGVVRAPKGVCQLPFFPVTG